MIAAGQIAEILSLYRKHEWQLRRVLLTTETEKRLAEAARTLFGVVQIKSSALDAAWFARPSVDGEAWELRQFAGSPFALVEVFDKDLTAAELDKKLHTIEEKMLARQTKSEKK